MRYMVPILLVCVSMVLRLPAAVIETSYKYSLKDGSSLTIRRSYPGIHANEHRTYELLYGRPDGTQTNIWTSPDYNGTFTLSDVRAAHISDGRITALFNLGSAEVFILQVPEIPGTAEPRSLELTGLLNLTIREEFRLFDHNHFEILGEGRAKQTVSFDPKSATATVDGKPVTTYLFYQGQFLELPKPTPSNFQPPSPPSPKASHENSDSVRTAPVETRPQSSDRAALTPKADSTSGLSDNAAGWPFSKWIIVLSISIALVIVVLLIKGRDGKSGTADKR
jgi:hypothetical protein